MWSTDSLCDNSIWSDTSLHVIAQKGEHLKPPEGQALQPRDKPTHACVDAIDPIDVRSPQLLSVPYTPAWVTPGSLPPSREAGRRLVERPPRCARQYRAYDRGPHHKIPGVTSLAVMAVLRANN